jgi:hypothetical protein
VRCTCHHVSDLRTVRNSLRRIPILRNSSMDGGADSVCSPVTTGPVGGVNDLAHRPKVAAIAQPLQRRHRVGVHDKIGLRRAQQSRYRKWMDIGGNGRQHLVKMADLTPPPIDVLELQRRKNPAAGVLDGPQRAVCAALTHARVADAE